MADARPADAELIADAQDACAALESGTPEDAVTVIEGDDQNNHELVNHAIQVYCPQFG